MLTVDQAIDVLQDGDRRVRELLATVAEHDMMRPATIGGGEWSAKDLLGHLAFWEEIALETLRWRRRGERPRMEEAFTAGGTDELNAWNQERKRSWSLERIGTNAEQTHQGLISALGGLSDEEWRAKAAQEGSSGRPLGEELGAVLGAPQRPFGHAWAHLPDLEAFVSALRSA